VASDKNVDAWDLPTRLFHWALVLVLAAGWASYEYKEAIGDNTMQWHRYNGYAALILIVWRLMWGIVGSSTSRFRVILTWPWNAARYGVDLVRGRQRKFLGHNPLGSYMVLALLAAVTFQTVLGLLSTEHNYLTWGPLSHLVGDETGKLVTRWHRQFFDILLILVAIHVTANILYGLIKKEPVVKAMVTGRKPAADYADASAAAIPSTVILRALACLALAAAVVLGGIVALGGKLIY
jgi:cytochrome b